MKISLIKPLVQSKKSDLFDIMSAFLMFLILLSLALCFAALAFDMWHTEDSTIKIASYFFMVGSFFVALIGLVFLKEEIFSFFNKNKLP